MDFNTIPLFGIMKSKLDYLAERQSVLAQNVANADTPGYKAMDISLPDFKKMMGGASQNLKMTTTSPMHMASGGGADGGMFKIEQRATTDSLKPDGNNVSIEEEMAKVSDNQGDYQKVISMYGKMISMFKTAIGNANTGS